jgi:hypothetical protein
VNLLMNREYGHALRYGSAQIDEVAGSATNVGCQWILGPSRAPIDADSSSNRHAPHGSSRRGANLEPVAQSFRSVEHVEDASSC